MRAEYKLEIKKYLSHRLELRPSLSQGLLLDRYQRVRMACRGDALTPQRSLQIFSRSTGSWALLARSLIRAGAITGFQLINDFPPFTCDSCEYAKMTWKPIHKEREAPQAQAFGDEIYTDVWGPSPTFSLGGRCYYVTFTDDCTRFTRLVILQTKDEAFTAYKSFSSWAKTQHGATVKHLRSDRGGEFTSNKFTSYLKQQGTEC